MNSKLVIGAVGCLALLGACSTERAQTSQAQAGTEFSNVLARQYHGFAEQQRIEAFDWRSAGFFREKGDIAAGGTVVEPEVPGQRFTPRDADVRPQLVSARQRLETALANPAARTRAATPLARAQVRYDCWLESTDDPFWAEQGAWLNRKLQECRSEFESAMAEVDTAMRPAPAPVAAARPPREQSLLLFFDFDRYEITPEGEAVIQRVVDYYRQGGSARIVATGHADRAGPEDYNMALSDRRADAVQQALLQRGVSVPITTVARGEEQPLIPTPDGQPEPQNRRVEIVLE